MNLAFCLFFLLLTTKVVHLFTPNSSFFPSPTIPLFHFHTLKQAQAEAYTVPLHIQVTNSQHSHNIWSQQHFSSHLPISFNILLHLYLIHLTEIQSTWTLRHVPIVSHLQRLPPHLTPSFWSYLHSLSETFFCVLQQNTLPLLIHSMILSHQYTRDQAISIPSLIFRKSHSHISPS